MRPILPPISPAARNEEAKLTASFINAMAIAAFITGAFGPYITAIPDEQLPATLRAPLVFAGLAIHVAARLVLRYIK